jgi:hypothetical protein
MSAWLRGPPKLVRRGHHREHKESARMRATRKNNRKEERNAKDEGKERKGKER